jgi:hypothetical protein
VQLVSADTPSMEPAQTFLNFLEDHNIENVSKINDNIMDLVSDNYDALDQETMRAMVDCALAERDVNVAIGGQENDLLGSWGVIIDTFKEQTMLRRERAGNNLQQLVAFGLQSTGGSAVQTFIDSIRQKGQVDSVLIDLVESSLADVDKEMMELKVFCVMFFCALSQQRQCQFQHKFTRLKLEISQIKTT